jgi:hypothetical protein
LFFIRHWQQAQGYVRQWNMCELHPSRVRAFVAAFLAENSQCGGVADR